MAIAELDLTSVTEIAAAVDALGRAIERLVPHALDRDGLLDAAVLFARGSKLCAAGTLLITPSIEQVGAFRRDGHKNAAELLATVGGTSTGTAIATVDTAKKLESRPDTADAVRRGDLSAAQAAVIAGAPKEDEERLLSLVPRRGLKGLQEEANRCAHARRSEEDAMAAYRRIHGDRHLRTWMANGAFCFSGSTTPDEGARLMGGINSERERLFKQANRDGLRENPDAYAIDALINVIVGTDVKPKRPKAALTVRADAAAIERGHVEPGEACEVEGFGPIPVTIARQLLVDADIHGVMFEGADIRDVSSTKRTIPARLRRALEARDPTCSVPGCDQTKGLEIDHIWEFGKQGPTELDNLDRKCRAHHRMKTIYGWRLTGPPGDRQWLPPPSPD